MNSAAFGLLTALLIGVFTITTTTSDPMQFFNLHGLVIVIGGTCSVAIIGYDFKELAKTFKHILLLFRAKPISHTQVVEQLVRLSKTSSRGQPLTTKSIHSLNLHPFIGDGIRYVENGLLVDDIEDILTQAVLERKEELSREIDIVNALSKYPPAFGMVGTVFGLIAMMHGLSDSGASSRLGTNMAVALVATLYGLITANYIFQPIADRLSDRLKKELHLRRIIIRGIILLHQKEDTILVQETLNAFLLPSQRLSEDFIVSSAASVSSPRKAA